MNVMSMCLCISPHLPINFWMPESILTQLSTHIMAPEPIPTAHLYNSLTLICVSVCPLSLLGNGSVKILPRR
jgi:hypothetical protein